MKKNNEEQDRDLEAAVNLIKHIRNFYEAIPPVMQQMCTEAILDAAGEMQKNGDLKPAMAELEYLPPSLHTGEIDLLWQKFTGKLEALIIPIIRNSAKGPSQSCSAMRMK